ncbi:methyltransferase domain-containing protein [Pseudochryseolinea flava]|uniref:Methyltransferase domain-containing protein n=1 Tax=Pseudochryseolinea flava TaxID=2059302 RepID=A0A364Y8B2_9BACT|nr:methyltransferase domain-containing protein [Pseudochryseolinea flava]RAW03356.1 hypothetical protein DQQ10_04530 [Pseudochryseolinea flava]
MKLSSLNKFDRIAHVYDWLAKVFIGEDIRHAQRFFLHEISDAKRILIIGGGTGWILHDIGKINPTAEILYVEASSSMIDMAKQININNPITFLHGIESDVDTQSKFDAVITNFYVDLFSDASLEQKIKIILPLLDVNGKWLVTDFVQSKNVYHRFLLWTMYLFFRVVTNIEARSMPQWLECMTRENLDVLKKQFFRNGFICSLVFRRGLKSAKH